MQSLAPVLSSYNGEFVHEETIAKNQPPYLPLHIARVQYSDGSLSVISKYGLSWKERLKILFSGVIWFEQLTPFGAAIRPQRITAFEPLTEE